MRIKPEPLDNHVSSEATAVDKCASMIAEPRSSSIEAPVGLLPEISNEASPAPTSATSQYNTSEEHREKQREAQRKHRGKELNGMLEATAQIKLALEKFDQVFGSGAKICVSVTKTPQEDNNEKDNTINKLEEQLKDSQAQSKKFVQAILMLATSNKNLAKEVQDQLQKHHVLLIENHKLKEQLKDLERENALKNRKLTERLVELEKENSRLYKEHMALEGQMMAAETLIKVQTGSDSEQGKGGRRGKSFHLRAKPTIYKEHPVGDFLVSSSLILLLEHM